MSRNFCENKNHQTSLVLTGINLTQAKVDNIIQAPKAPTNNVKHVR